MAGLVFALNPAVDAEWFVPEVLLGEKTELANERRWPGGKGVNVARWLRWLGNPARLFLTLGGATGRELAAGLRAESLRFASFPLRQPTRVNVVVTPEQGPQLRFNPSWPRLNRTESARLRREACRLARTADPVVIAGTLAFGAPVGTYAAMVSAARSAGRRVFLDCDREAFALAARAGPFLVKPNEVELAQWAGRALRGEASIRRAARGLSQVTGGWVLVSRGGAGALLVNVAEETVLAATAPRVAVRNTVGAGDALLAGVVSAVGAGEPPPEWLRAGVASGTAATLVPPGQLPSRRQWRELRAGVAVR